MYSKSLISLDEESSIISLGAPSLTPAQESLAAAVAAESHLGELTIVHILPGMGRTTVLKTIHSRIGGAFFGLRQILSATVRRAGDSLSLVTATFSRLIGRHSTVLVDDGHLLARSGMTAMLDQMTGDNRLVVACDDSAISETARRAANIRMKNFGSEDYAEIIRYYLGDAAEYLDMGAVYRYSASLSASELKHASLWLGLRYERPDTNAMIRYLAGFKQGHR